MSGILTGKGILMGLGILAPGILKGGIIVPPDSPYDPDAQDYFDRAEALDPNAFDLDSFVGGLYPPVVKGYWNNFIISLKADGTWDQLDEIFPGCGVTFAGITAKLKHSGNDEVALANFVFGDYTPAGPLPGLKGNGTSKEINSNWSPSDTITVPSGHYSMFTTEEASGISREGSDNSTTQTLSGYFTLNGTLYSDAFSTDGGRISVATSTIGMIIVNANATAHRVLLDNSLVVTGASPTGIVPTADFYFYSIGGSSFSDARRSIRTMGQGLTAGQETTLNNAVTALMTSLGYL